MGVGIAREFHDLARALGSLQAAHALWATDSRRHHVQQHDVGPNYAQNLNTDSPSLPTHRSRAERGKPSASFSANLEKGVFQCFSCKASGNVLDFVCIMEGLNPADSAGIRKAAVFAQEKFLGRGESHEREPPARRTPSNGANGHDTALSEPLQVPAKGQVRVNPPLDFELKGLDPEHKYLKERGFNEETIQHFGLGFCSRGLLSGRIGIPLRDQAGKLIGYAGRIVDERRIDDEHPKYLFPGTRERNGTVLEFRKSLFLYNAHAITKPVEDLIVVEGFPSAWWLWQWGFPNVVATMGSSCSPEQARLIVSLTLPHDGCVWAFTDADQGGEELAASLLPQVTLHRLCRRVQAKSGQPTDCTPGELAEMFDVTTLSPSRRMPA